MKSKTFLFKIAFGLAYLATSPLIQAQNRYLKKEAGVVYEKILADLMLCQRRSLSPEEAKGFELERKILFDLISKMGKQTELQIRLQNPVDVTSRDACLSEAQSYLSDSPIPVELSSSFILQKSKEIFTEHCVYCHGAQPSQNLPASSFFAIQSIPLELRKPLRYYLIASQGNLNKSMPSFRDILSTEEIWSAVFYFAAMPYLEEPKIVVASRDLSLEEIALLSDQEIPSSLRADVRVHQTFSKQTPIRSRTGTEVLWQPRTLIFAALSALLLVGLVKIVRRSSRD